MLPLIVLFARFCFNSAQYDYSCTEFDAAGVAVFSETSTICQDKFTLPECTQLFTVGHAAVIPGTALLTVGRPFGCYGIHGVFGINDGVKNPAIEYCPKFCGFCCLTPEYNCDNAPAPRLECGSITQDMCRSLLWRELIAEDCPSQCGFCLLGGCIDVAPDCEADPTICGNPALNDFTSINCRRTCGLCDTLSTTTNSSVSAGSNCTATDRSSDCALWNRNGFCASPFYTEDQKREYCAATCDLCDSSASSATVSSNAIIQPTTVVNATQGSACPADTSNTCALWNRNGFCNSSFYTEDQKRAYCAATCSLC